MTGASPRARLPWAALLAAALLQAAAAPPGWLPGAALLVVPGLALQCALALGARRPLLASYLFGVLYTGAFSWSLRHVLLPGWAAIAVVGGLYTLACAVATRVLRPRLGAPLAFGIALAGVCWLRAEMPEIWYPHGQPCHDFWRWPQLLGAVRLGGEPLANGLLGAFGAALWQLAQRPAWDEPRTRSPHRRAALAVVGLALGVGWLGAPRSPATPPATVEVAAVEPGVHPTDWLEGIESRAALRERWERLFAEHWLAPTRGLLGAAPRPLPDLVLWPESSLFDVLPAGAPGSAPKDRVAALIDSGFAEEARLCVGASVQLDGVERPTPAALLLDGAGRRLGHHEKRRLVPAGEFLPFVGLLPAALAAPIRRGIAQVMGADFEVLPGRVLPPLRTRGEVPFSALICYDNAFPTTVAAEVAQGARFLVVLSNEAWYRGGSELDQLAAITVLRAIATATPIVRCTTDGRSLAVDGQGRILAELTPQPAPSAARVLRVAVPLGSGELSPWARAHPILGWAAAIGVLAACALAWLRRSR